MISDARLKDGEKPYSYWAEAVMAQSFYTSGERFSASDIRPAIDRATPNGRGKLSLSSLHSIMRWMANEGLVDIVDSTRGIVYRRPVTPIMSTSWRTVSDESIGLPERRLGATPEWERGYA